MALLEELNIYIKEQIEENNKTLQEDMMLLRPWLRIDTVRNELLDGASRKWVIDTFCKEGSEAYKRKLVKKVGGVWHFRNPEFSQYVHNDFWESQE